MDEKISLKTTAGIIIIAIITVVAVGASFLFSRDHLSLSVVVAIYTFVITVLIIAICLWILRYVLIQRKILKFFDNKSDGSKKRKFKLNFRTKINILIENMNYASDIRGYFEKNKREYNSEIFLWESEAILSLMQLREMSLRIDEPDLEASEKRYREITRDNLLQTFQKFDIISLPYFVLQEAVNENYIVSLEEYSSTINDSHSELGETLIQSIKSADLGPLVTFQNNTFGLPFTEISVVLAYNKARTRQLTSPISPHADLEKLGAMILDKELRFGMLDAKDASSHFYDFLNFTTYYDLRFLEFDETYEYAGVFDNWDSPDVLKALRLYLTFYIHSYKHQGSWATMVDGLRLGTFDACFLWTEQISELDSANYLRFQPIVRKGRRVAQADGWFLAIVKKWSDRGEEYKDNLLEVLDKIKHPEFQDRLLSFTLSGAMYPGTFREGDQDEELTAFTRNSAIVAKVLKHAVHKSNLPFMGDLAKMFSRSIVDRCRESSSVVQVANRVQQQLLQFLHAHRS